jgi:hypothetical protein
MRVLILNFLEFKYNLLKVILLKETPDGRKSKTVFNMEGDKMIQIQRDPKTGAVITTIIREVQGDKLISTLQAGSVTASRVFKRT